MQVLPTLSTSSLYPSSGFLLFIAKIILPIDSPELALLYLYSTLESLTFNPSPPPAQNTQESPFTPSTKTSDLEETNTAFSGIFSSIINDFGLLKNPVSIFKLTTLSEVPDI